MTGNPNFYQGVLAVLFASVAVIGCSDDQGHPAVADEAAFPTAAEEQAMMEENKRNAAKRGWGTDNLKPVEWPPSEAADPSGSENADAAPAAPEDDAEI